MDADLAAVAALGVTAAGSDGFASSFGVSLATIGTNFTCR